jgi:amino acid transporter
MADFEDTNTQPVSEAAPSPEELLLGGDKKERLGPWYATAICGNDITSSCLYVSAIAIVYAGAMAPLSLLLAAGVLYLYKKIYTEVVEALPLDGGAYNALLNCTRRFDASFAACLTILSYLATAVISAKTAAEYLKSLLPWVPPMEATAGIIIVFAILCILGISESARVALVIFVLHLVTLMVFVIWCLPELAKSSQMFTGNWSLTIQAGHWPKALFLGFSAAMLGVSGFETSANFVEEQKPGVFRLTLRNMWLAVTFFNPLIALLALGLLPISGIVEMKEGLLSHLGMMVGGQLLHTLIVVDAFLVLSGAVLTSYVGITGLVHRMTLDMCFPQILLTSTRRGSFPLIILGFMIACISILYITGGHLLSLAGVYTIAFLGVMTLFGIANILLKVHRKELKRTFRASWTTVILGVLATMAGIIGNLYIDFSFIWYFSIYFLPAVTGGILMYFRIPILTGLMILIDRLLARISEWRLGVEHKIAEFTNVRVVLFVRRGQRLARMQKAFDYIERNEDCRNILVFRLYEHEDPEMEARCQRNLDIIRELYPDMTINYINRQSKFNPETVEAISKELNVPKNFMFMGALTEKQPFSLQDLGGVRIIF